MRADSLAGQVVAVLSRRTPALQPAPGEPGTFPHWIHRLFLLLRRSRNHAARTTETIVRHQVERYGPDIVTVPPERRPASSDFDRTWHPRPHRHFMTGVAVLSAVMISVVAIPTVLLASQIRLTSAEPASHDSTSAAIVASRGASTPVQPPSIAPGWIPSGVGAQPRRPSPVRSSGTATACPTQGLGGGSTSPACVPSAAAVSRPPASASPAPATVSPPPATTPAPTPQTNVASPTPSSCAVPTVTSISPSQGSEAGGETVIIIGTGFGVGAKVSFGRTSANTATIQSSTKITATSPPGQPGQSVVDVTVACDGTVSSAVSSDQFTYVMATPSATPTAPASSFTATGERQNP
jgi:hypothetical protein